MTLQSAIEETIRLFDMSGIAQPHFEARQLVQECLGLTFAQLMSHPDRELEESSLQKLRKWRDSRVVGVPLAYLSQRKGFYKYDFHVEPGVLVPRPETELVVETALRRMEDRSDVRRIADLGCGSGCIGLSLVSEQTDMHLWSVDVSPKACEVTLRNALQLGVAERVTVENRRVEDWSPEVSFDMVVANPPYIAVGDTRVEEHVRKHEPAEALFAGEDGSEAIESWVAWTARNMKLKGVLVCEIGAGQSRTAQDIFARHGFDHIQVERDLSGHERVVSGLRAAR